MTMMSSLLKEVGRAAFLFRCDKSTDPVLLPETGISTLLRIYGTRWLTIQVNATSGRVDIKEAETVVGSVLEARLASGARYANMHPDKLIEVLIALRTAFIMEATEEKLVSLRLSISRQVPGTSEGQFGFHFAE